MQKLISSILLVFFFIMGNVPLNACSSVLECVSQCCACACPCYDEEDGFTCDPQCGEISFKATAEAAKTFTSDPKQPSKPSSPALVARAATAQTHTKASPLLDPKK